MPHKPANFENVYYKKNTHTQKNINDICKER